MTRKYRRVARRSNDLYFYEVLLLIFIALIALLSIVLYAFSEFYIIIRILMILVVVVGLLAFYSLLSREVVTRYEIPEMNKFQVKFAKKILKLFTDKQIIDVLKLSNKTKFGEEIPLIQCYIEPDLKSGFLAIENICSFDRMDKAKYEQVLSGIFSGSYSRFAVVRSNLSEADTHMIFYFEDVKTSNRLVVTNGNVKEFVLKNPRHLRLSQDLIWNTEISPHMAIVARTRSGKSVFAGDYLAELMLAQGWAVEYSSVKPDIYVDRFAGESDPKKVVQRAMYWVEVMEDRLEIIKNDGKQKYFEVNGLRDIGLIFDELGNLNAFLELDKTLKREWETAISRLTATGGSAGIHVISISQYATREGFLPTVARTNSADAVIMLGGAADSADDRRFLMPGFADLPRRSYGVGQGVAKFLGSGKKWETPRFYETPLIIRSDF